MNNDELRAEIKRVQELKGEALTDQEIWRIYFAQFLKDRRAGTLENYDPAELKELNRIYSEWREKFDNVIEEFKKNPDAFNDLYPTETDENKLASVKAFRAGEFVAPTDAISRTVFNEIEPKVKTPVYVGDKGKQPVEVYVGINLDSLPGVTIARELTLYDQEVQDAILSLYLAGNHFITYRMIYQTMTGATPNDAAKASGISKKSLSEIEESVTKLMYCGIVVDASEEAKAYGYEEFEYDGVLLPGERIKAKINGVKVDCLHILRTPVLYAYSNRKGQVSRVDIKLLNTPVRKTRENITLQGYLLRRIEGMKNGHISNSIVYTTVFKALGLDKDEITRKKKKQIRDLVQDILTTWKKDGYIKGFAEEMQGQSYYKVIIEY